MKNMKDMNKKDKLQAIINKLKRIGGSVRYTESEMLESGKKDVKRAKSLGNLKKEISTIETALLEMYINGDLGDDLVDQIGEITDKAEGIIKSDNE